MRPIQNIRIFGPTAANAPKSNEANISIRSVNSSDLPGVVQVHQQAFPHFLMTRLGSQFLRMYYLTVLNDSNSIFYVALREQQIVGFVAGFVKPASFYHMLRKQRLRIAFSMAPRLLSSPNLLFRVIGIMKTLPRRSSSQETSDCAELASLAVLPKLGRQGLGKQLVQAFCKKAFAQQAKHVVLTTDGVGNLGANRFYLGLGFKKREDFTVRGKRLMTRYALTPEAALAWTKP